MISVGCGEGCQAWRLQAELSRLQQERLLLAYRWSFKPNSCSVSHASSTILFSAMLMISDVFKSTKFSWSSLNARWEKLNKAERTLEEKRRFSG